MIAHRRWLGSLVLLAACRDAVPAAAEVDASGTTSPGVAATTRGDDDTGPVASTGGADGSGSTTSDPTTSDPTTSDPTTSDTGGETSTTGEPPPACPEPGDPFAIDRLRDRLEALASPALGGRVPGTAGDLQARGMIAEAFACAGLQPGGVDGTYEHPFVNAGGDATANVVALIPGSDPRLASEIVLVGAHHDHFGEVDGELLLGANDNASGVVGVLAIAEALAQRAAPRRTVVFVAFGSEETASDYPYVEGSAAFVAEPPPAVPIDDVVYVINLDMIGTYDDEQVVYALGTYEGTPARQVFEQWVDAHPELDVDLGEPPEIGSSDHYPFCEAGIPFAFLWTDDFSCYHAACDTPDRIDDGPMAEIAALVFDVTAALADLDTSLHGVSPGSCGE